MSLKLFYSQLNLHSSALHECLKRCSPAMQACLETYDDTLYCNTTDCSVAKRLSQSCKHSNSAPQCCILMFVRVSNDVPQPYKHVWKHSMIPCIVPYQGRGYNGFGEKNRFRGRGQKGNVNGGKRWNSLPFHRGAGQKGNAKRETRRNPLLLKPARSLKGNANGVSRQKSLLPSQLLRRLPPHFPMSL